MSLLDNPLVHKLGWTLFHTVWQDVAIAIIFAVVLVSMRRSAPNARYLAALVALAAIAIAPIVTFLVLPGEQAVTPATQVLVSKALAQQQVSITPNLSGWDALLARLEPVTPQIVGLWLVGLALMGLRLLGGLFLVERTRRLAIATPNGEWQGRVDELAMRLGIHRPVQLMLSEYADVPAAIGVLRQVVLLPASAMSKLSPAQIEALLAHELAHIKRYDYLVNLLQSAVEMAQFYHPAVWWISSLMRTERENCCDDLAVQALGDRVGYARALASLEELRVLAPQLAMTANGGSLMQRIKRILGGPTRMSRAGFAWLPCIAVAALIVPFGAFAQSHKKTSKEKPELQVEVNEHQFGKSMREHFSKVLNDPNATIVIDGKTRKVKDLSPQEKKEIKRRMEKAAVDADKAMADARKAVIEAKEAVRSHTLAIPSFDWSWDWSDDEENVVREKKAVEEMRAEAEVSKRDAEAQRREVETTFARAVEDNEKLANEHAAQAEIAQIDAKEQLAEAQVMASEAAKIELLTHEQALAEVADQDGDHQLSKEERQKLEKQMEVLRRQMQKLREQMRQQFKGDAKWVGKGEFKMYPPMAFDGKKWAEEFHKNFNGKDFKLQFKKGFDDKKFAEEMAKQAKEWARMGKSFNKDFGHSFHMAPDFPKMPAMPSMPPMTGFPKMPDMPSMPPMAGFPSVPTTPPSQSIRVDGDQISIHKLPQGGYEIRIWKDGKSKKYKVKPDAKGAMTIPGNPFGSTGSRVVLLPDGQALSLTAPVAVKGLTGFSMVPVKGLRITTRTPLKTRTAPIARSVPGVRVYTLTTTAPPAPAEAPKSTSPTPEPAPSPAPSAPSAASPDPFGSAAASSEPAPELATSKILSLPSFGRLL